MDFSAAATLLSSLNAAKDLAQASIDLSNTMSVQAKLSDLSAKLFEARGSALALQQEQATLLNRIQALEQECMQLRERRREKERYQLQEVYPGAFAYARKPRDDEPDSPHWLCQRCFEKGENFVLQSRQGDRSWRVWFCPECKTEFKANPFVSPSKPFTPKEN